MPDALYPAAAIAVVALVTWALRAFPFVLFGDRPLPKAVRFLEQALPPAIMLTLVVYCLRDTDLTRAPYGIPALAASAVTVLLQWIRKNMYLSIIAGTLCYMILLRAL